MTKHRSQYELTVERNKINENTSLISKPSRFQLYAFNSASVIGMMLNFSLFFTLAPDLTNIATVFDVDKSIVLQLPTIYEIGKLIGVVALGALSEKYNVLKVVNASVGIFCVCCGGLVAWFYVWEPSKQVDFWIFVAVYFILSMTSVSTQLGLTYLRIVNTAEGYRQVVVAQSILGSILHASLLFAGSILVHSFDWRAPFVFMLSWGVFSCILMFFTSFPMYNLCASNNKQKKIELDSTCSSKLSNLWNLLAGSKYRNFQTNIFLLGASTACMYLYPTYAIQLLTNIYHVPLFNSGLYIFIVYVSTNTVGRILSLVLVREKTDLDLFKMPGGLFLVLGSALFVFMIIFLPKEIFSVLIPGACIMIGVGLTMPHCKAGALESMEKHNLVVANSILKISQLLFSFVFQSIAGIIYQSTKSIGIAAELLLLNGFVVILYMLITTIKVKKQQKNKDGNL